MGTEEQRLIAKIVGTVLEAPGTIQVRQVGYFCNAESS